MQDSLQSPEDLEEVFHALNTDIYAYVAARVRSRAIAEDIAQEVFIRAWEKRKQFDARRGSLKNWIYAIALNAVRDYFRKQKGKIIQELPEDIESTENIERDISKKQLHARIIKQLHTLSDKEQELLTLRYMQELSIEEIAEIIGKRYSATKVAVHRAEKKLKKCCNHFCP